MCLCGCACVHAHVRAKHTELAGLWVSEDSFVFASHLPTGATHYRQTLELCIQLLCGFWGFSRSSCLYWSPVTMYLGVHIWNRVLLGSPGWSWTCGNPVASELPVIPVPEGSDFLFWPLQTPALVSIHHWPHVHIIRIKWIFFFFKKKEWRASCSVP